MTRQIPTIAIFVFVMLCQFPFGTRPDARAQDTVGGGGGATPTAPAAPHGWPRSYSDGSNTVVMYQPQVDAWKDHEKIRFRAAIAVTPALSTQTQYGVV